MKILSNLNRRFFFLAMFCSVFMAAAAQENNFSSVKPGSKINLVMDFSKASIMGMNETDFSNYEKDWNKDKPTILGRFQKGVNGKLGDFLKIGSYPDSPYTMKVEVKTVSDVGNIYCDVAITDKDGTILFSAKNVNGGAEPPLLPGTKLAKIKAWAFLAGRSLGGIMKSEYLAQ